MKFENIKEKVINIYRGHKLVVWISAGLLAVLIAAAVIFLPRSSAPTIDGNVQFVEVTRGSITETIGEVGYVEAEPSVLLTWSSEGTVADYDVQIGDQVEKGDVLMELETSSWPNDSLDALSDLLAAELEAENLVTSDYELQVALQAVVDAEMTVKSTREMVDFWNFAQSPIERVMDAREYYTTALREYWAAEESYEDLRQVLDEDDPDLVAAYETLQEADLVRDKQLRALNQILGHSYDHDVETDFLEWDAAKDDFQVARAEYIRLLDESEEIDAAEANVQALQNTVNEARIIAPFDGTITEISYLPGEYVSSGSTAVQLDDLSNMVVGIAVSEIDIEKLEIGQPVIVTFDALPYKEYSGEVTSIAAASSDSDGSVSFDVVVTITDGDEDIKPGFSADVSIIISDAADVLLLPTQALRGQEGNYRVMVAGDDGATIPVSVEIGASSDEYTEVVSGDLHEGDRVLVSLSNGLFGEGDMDMMRMMRQMEGDAGGPPQGGEGGAPPNGGQGGPPQGGGPQ